MIATIMPIVHWAAISVMVLAGAWGAYDLFRFK